jgi:hypothetical protein
MPGWQWRRAISTLVVGAIAVVCGSGSGHSSGAGESMSSTSTTESSIPHYHSCLPSGNGSNLPYCNWTLPISIRVTDLVSRLTLLEKVSGCAIQCRPPLWSGSTCSIDDSHLGVFNQTLSVVLLWHVCFLVLFLVLSYVCSGVRIGTSTQHNVGTSSSFSFGCTIKVGLIQISGCTDKMPADGGATRIGLEPYNWGAYVCLCSRHVRDVWSALRSCPVAMALLCHCPLDDVPSQGRM